MTTRVATEEVINISALPLSRQNVAVPVERKFIEAFAEHLQERSEEEIESRYRSAYKFLINFDADDTFKRVKQGNEMAKKKFNHFNQEVIVAHTIRLYLYGEPIPVMETIPDSFVKLEPLLK